MEELAESGQPSKRPREGEQPIEGEEDLLEQYQTAELPAPPPEAQTGVLRGKKVSVSSQFSPEDQQTASRVIVTHGG